MTPDRHDGPTLTRTLGGAATRVACGCGWTAQRFGSCRVPLIRAWHAHVLAARAAEAA